MISVLIALDVVVFFASFEAPLIIVLAVFLLIGTLSCASMKRSGRSHSSIRLRQLTGISWRFRR